MVLYTDSKSLHDCIVGINATYEKRILIDLLILRQFYELRESNEIVWIPSAENPADAINKQNASEALKNIIDSNHVKLTAKSCVNSATSSSREEKYNLD